MKIKIKLATFFLLSLIMSLCLFFDNGFLGFHYPDSLSQSPIRSVKIVKGITTVNGKPLFPLGFYHVSWQSTAVERIKAMQNIAKAGFNTIHVSSTTDINDESSYGDFLDRSAQQGIYVITEQQINLQNVVKEFKHKPAVLAWNIADDVNDGKQTPHDIRQLNHKIKSLDSNHITYISGYSDEIYKFENCSDIIAMQSYPIGNNDEISSTYRRVSLTRETVAPFNGTVYANIQAFSWSDSQEHLKHPVIPTFNEVRNMTYQALVAGAKGIIYYTYYDRSWYLPDHPQLWEGLKSLVPEIKTITPFLLQGSWRKIDINYPNIFGAIWVLNGQALAIVVNASDQAIDHLIISLPISVKNLHSSVPEISEMNFGQGKLYGKIQPLAVHIYSGNL
ncbi:MAG TPA: hypothetical protein DCS91_07045 [Microcoleaceae bacterium UBA11344]|jgi:hypothetical protein|nr:hypothetical protein [Microcoleaceae cyanobacterium UBA11344]